MTAEVIVANRQAMALAADSAVTVQRAGPGGGVDVKVYDSANKIFQISPTEPIAAMIYGSGSFASVPWETIMKEFRRDLGRDSYSCVEDYSQRFVKFLQSFVLRLNSASRGQFVIDRARSELDSVMSSAFAQIRNDIFEAAFSDDAMGGLQIRSRICDTIASRIEELETFPTYSDIDRDEIIREINEMIPDWDEFLRLTLGGLDVDTELSEMAMKLAVASLHSRSRSYWHSGLVIAGVGKDELFPSFKRHAIDGIIADKLRTYTYKDSSAQGIFAFAQADVIATIIDGIHPAVHKTIERYVADSVGNFTKYILDQLKSKLSKNALRKIRRDIGDYKSRVVGGFEEGLERYLQDWHSNPILDVVEGLPKDELADMAEALVSLTSFQHRVTPGDETVGGPVDVAVISKGDGFIWVKRKHYFSPEHNVRYMESIRRQLDPQSLEVDPQMPEGE